MRNLASSIVHFGLPYCLAFSLLGCAGRVVQKARLQNIKTVTILGLFASDRVAESTGQGLLRGQDDAFRNQVAEDALLAFSQSMARIGWSVTSPDDLGAHPVYREVFAPILSPMARRAKERTKGGLYEPRYMLPAQMAPVWLEPVTPSQEARVRRVRPRPPTQKEAVGIVLRDLGSDAAVGIQLRYCFRVYRRDLEERARVVAFAAVQIADRQARILYESALPRGCGSGSDGYPSVGSVAMAERDWVLQPDGRDAALALFKEASISVAHNLMETLPVLVKPR